ncbi:hypothetical protein BEL04_12610 [Mucilaginibacter sp. PPCGB 2223]|uniref:FG-GAP-like repeat-containing protein n=1 Tax=Mucilaginibacter sp. PPCGB 2223 TaxID=1886027 RepID=UPI0008557B54|nr:FG-GAP-like repeat-containing protein [Mucilaginibacter sp. PPCGB 2223]OCX52311.1 hypothetical protein BEL04_12610 [Mucilaginibacter sp. PPCGB 2223]
MKKYLLFCLLYLITLLAVAQAPLVTSFSPASGPVGTMVTISGFYFNPSASANIVSFGGVRATVSAASPTSLTITVPPGGTYQPIAVLNTANGLSGNSVRPFIVTADNKGNFTSSDLEAKVDFNTGVVPQPICMSDLDGDGKLDVAVLNTNYTSNSISLFRNTSTRNVPFSTSSFATRVDIATNNNPSLLMVQDIDGDGRPDLIAAAGGTVSIYHNNATAGVINASSFAPKVDFTILTSSFSDVHIADIDGDGKPDILVTDNAGTTLSILLNKTTTGSINSNSFAAKVDIPIACYRFAVADLDNDGKLDIAGINTPQNTVSVLHNIMTVTGSVSAASFGTKVDFATSKSPSSIIAADVTGDGKLDLIVGYYLNNAICILQNSTNGGVINSSSFGAEVDFTTGKSPNFITVNDIDGDGQVDIVVSNFTDNTISLFHNVYTGGAITSSSFSPKVDLATGLGPSGTVTGDIDGDGRPEIAVCSGASFSLYRNNPTNPPVISAVSPWSGPVGSTVTITGLNFNKDAVGNNIVYFGATRATVISATNTQLAVTVPPGSTYQPISVLNSETRRTGFSIKPFNVTYPNNSVIKTIDFATPGNAYTTTASQTGIELADIDGDGKPDMITADLSTKNIGVWLNTGSVNQQLTGQFAGVVFFDGGDAIDMFKIADLDGDGKPDIATINSKTQILSILHNISTPGHVAFDKRIDFTVYANLLYTEIALADINMDGKPDVILSGGNAGYISVHRNTSTSGAISFAQPVILNNYLSSTAGTQIGDIDGDGKPDIVTYGAAVFRNTSTNTSISFDAPVSLTNLSWSVKLADLDGDGKLDIILPSNGNTGVGILRNTAVPGAISAASFAALVTLDAHSDRPTDVYIADMDGDGKPDIFTINGDQYGQSTIGILHNATTNSNLAFDYVTDLNIRSTAYHMAIGDIDGDGLPDILVPTGYNIQPFYYRPLNVSQSTPPIITSIAPTRVAIGSTVTITGSGFNPQAQKNIVLFGDVQAKITSASATNLSVTVPVGNNYSNLSVINTDNGLAGYSYTPVSVTFNSKQSIAATDFAAPVILTLGVNAIRNNTLLKDIDGDGKLDLLVFSYDVITSLNSLLIYRNISTTGSLTTSSFAAPVVFTEAVYGLYYVADMDADGKPDIIFFGSYNGGQNAYYFKKNISTAGNITFANYTGTTITQSIPAASGFVDIDGDGLPDLIGASGDTGYPSNSAWVMHNISRTPFTFSPPKSYLAAPATDAQNHLGLTALAVDDLDGDGKPDFAVTSQSGSVSILKNKAVPGIIDNSFAPCVNTSLTKYMLTSITSGDIDGDGKPDLIVSDFSDSTLFILRNTSTTANINFASAFQLKALPSAATILTDIDGDGKPDIVLTAYQSLSIFRNTSTSSNMSFSPMVNITNTGAAGTSIGDLDGDGKADLVTTSGNKIAIYRYAPPVPQPPAIASFTPTTASAGTTITIRGANLDNATAVSFGGTAAASYNLVSTSVITAVVASGTTGNVSVTTFGGTGNLPGFIFVPVPTITAGGSTTFTQGGNVVLTASPGTGYAYQWFKDGVAINGATAASYTATQSGAYTVSITLNGVNQTSATTIVSSVFTLPASNFSLSANSATCHGSANGTISIAAAQNLNYTATITGGSVNATYPFTTNKTISNLAAGTYNVCFTVAGQSSYQQCFTVVITEPKDLSVYAAVNNTIQSVNLTLDGGNTYFITLNGVTTTTTNSNISLALNKGINDLMVTTDKPCQGTYQKRIDLSTGVSAYPNPFTSTLHVNIGNDQVASATIELYNTAGLKVYSKQFNNVSGEVEIAPGNLMPGIYMLKLSTDQLEKVFKVVKQ